MQAAFFSLAKENAIYEKKKPEMFRVYDVGTDRVHGGNRSCQSAI